jgi:hypothetical protein
MPPFFALHNFQIIMDLLLWMLMFWTNLITIVCFFMHYSFPLLCLQFMEEITNSLAQINLINYEFGIGLNEDSN